jgi:dihydropteroate synthase
MDGLFRIMRKAYTWTLPRTEIELGRRTAVMGILNLTPDSFSDGGKYSAVEAALARAQEIRDQGADILDVGGESSRPGSVPISEEEELCRVMPVVEAVAHKLSIPISIDTYRSRVAHRALEAGAQIVNDISAFRFDPEMPRTVRTARAGIILMHSRGSREELHRQPPMANALTEVQDDLQRAATIAADAGIVRSAVVMDPGIGFGKSCEESVLVLRHLEAFTPLEYPLLIGTSRKSFLRNVSRKGPLTDEANRQWRTAASLAVAIANGAHIVRVHDVAEMRQFVDTLDAL